MAYIVLAEPQTWAEASKLTMTALDEGLTDTIATEVLARLAGIFDTSPWVDTTTTPKLVRKIIAMKYVGWYINRTYSSDEGMSLYAWRILQMADNLISGLIDGSIILVDDTNPANALSGTAQFYPTDASSALEPTIDDMSLGGPSFTMGVIW